MFCWKGKEVMMSAMVMVLYCMVSVLVVVGGGSKKINGPCCRRFACWGPMGVCCCVAIAVLVSLVADWCCGVVAGDGSFCW